MATSARPELEYTGDFEVEERVAQPPKVYFSVDLDLRRSDDYEGTFYIPDLRYRVYLESAPDYDESPNTRHYNLGIYRVSELIEEGQRGGINFSAPLYPEVIEKMNRITSQNRYVTFSIETLESFIFWMDTSSNGRVEEFNGFNPLESAKVQQRVRSDTISGIVLPREDVTSILTVLEDFSNEWLSIPIPAANTEDVSEELRDRIERAVSNLNNARQSLHTPSYGQAMIDLRNIRDELSVKEDRGDGERWYLVQDLEDTLESRIGERETRAVRNMLRSGSNFASKYVHEDRSQLKEEPPWDETKLVYSQYSHLVWFVAQKLH